MIDFGKKCIILTRVSTTQQDYQFQLDALYKYAEDLGLDKPLIDISTKESGFRSMEAKDGFKKVIKFLSENNCRIVLCTELSRLAREKIILEQIKEWFVNNKIQLYVKDQNFKLFNDNGEVDMTTDIIFSVYASMAQSEMREKKKRMSRGLGTLLSSGYAVVGPTAFGYAKRKTTEKINGKYRTELIIDEEKAEQVKKVFDWCLYGIGGDKTRCSVNAIVKESIARGFDPYLTSPSNVKKCLANEGYTGSKTTHNRRKNPAYWDYGHKDEPRYIESRSHTIKYPAIISREKFEAVQKKMRSGYNHLDEVGLNVYADKSRTHITLLAKILICPVCGRFLTGNYRQREDRLMAYYRCGEFHQSRNTFAMPLFDTAIWEFCKSNYETYLDFLKKSAGTDTTEIDKRIVNYHSMIDNIEKEKDEYLAQILSLGKMSPKLQAKVKAKVDEYDSQIAELNSSILREQETLETIKMMSDLSDTELALETSKEEMRKYIQLLVHQVLPVYKTVRLYVLKVTLNRGILVPYTTHEESQVEVDDVPVYLIIDGIQGCSPKVRCVYSPSVVFDQDNGTFTVDGTTVNVKDVFEDVEDEFSREIVFRRLNIYQDDTPKNK